MDIQPLMARLIYKLTERTACLITDQEVVSSIPGTSIILKVY